MDKIFVIRNGKTFVKKDAKDNTNACANEIISKEIENRISGKLNGKVFYVPEYIEYSVPTSEKQILDVIPYGTYVTCPDKAYTIGICWENYKGRRTDLDLHMTGTNESFGFNAAWRANGEEIIFSGDMTDATNGAAECFCIKEAKKTLVVSAHNYEGMSNIPFKLILTEKTNNEWKNKDEKTPPINVEDAIFSPIELKFKDTNEMTIGFIDNGRFYFYGGEMGNGIVPKRDMYATAINAIKAKVKSQIRLVELLRAAGATVVRDEKMIHLHKDYISLAPADLTPTTIIDIVNQLD